MNRNTAKQIARSGITYGQIIHMLQRAYDDTYPDDSRSTLNPVMSKAACFNIMWRGHIGHNPDDIINGCHQIGAANALREFGSYWDGFKPKESKSEKYNGEYHHVELIDIYMSRKEV